MIKINLLPVKAAQKKEKLRGQLLVSAFCFFIGIAAFAAVYISLSNKISVIKEENAKYQEELNQLQSKIGEVGRFKKMKEELQGKLDVLDKLKEGQSGPVHLLDDLSKALPEKLWITSFKESAGAITINGVGINEETVAEFLRALEASPYYKGVELQVVEQTTVGGLKLQKFDLTCRAEAPVKNPAKS